MNSATSSVARKILDHLLNGTAYVSGAQTSTFSAAPTLWLGLFTADPSESGGGTEVTGGNYSRKALTAGSSWNAAVTSNDITYSSLAASQTFATPNANWGTITSVGVFDAATSGNLLFVATLATPTAVTDTNPPVIAAGPTGLKITLD